MANNMFATASNKRKTEQDNIIKNTTEKPDDKKIIPQNTNKKMISAQVTISVYDKFTKINKQAGLKNNAVLNNLIWDYVSKHEGEI